MSSSRSACARIARGVLRLQLAPAALFPFTQTKRSLISDARSTQGQWTRLSDVHKRIVRAKTRIESQVLHTPLKNGANPVDTRNRFDVTIGLEVFISAQRRGAPLSDEQMRIFFELRNSQTPAYNLLPVHGVYQTGDTGTAACSVAISVAGKGET